MLQILIYRDSDGSPTMIEVSSVLCPTPPPHHPPKTLAYMDSRYDSMKPSQYPSVVHCSTLESLRSWLRLASGVRVQVLRALASVGVKAFSSFKLWSK